MFILSELDYLNTSNLTACWLLSRFQLHIYISKATKKLYLIYFSFRLGNSRGSPIGVILFFKDSKYNQAFHLFIYILNSTGDVSHIYSVS